MFEVVVVAMRLAVAIEEVVERIVSFAVSTAEGTDVALPLAPKPPGQVPCHPAILPRRGSARTLEP